MFKPTPNPPTRPRDGIIDPRLVDQALAYYDLRPEANLKPTPASATVAATPNPPPTSLSHEDTLLDLHSILQSAAATAYENADNQSGSNRQVAMGVVHLIELAQLRMGRLEQQVVAASS